VFALASGIREVGERLRSDGMELVEIPGTLGGEDDASRTAELCREHLASWLVLDGFHFSQQYRATVRSGADHILLVDDHGEFAPYQCDVVLNTNPYASPQMYPPRDDRAHFLLGAEFALLRREFLEHRREFLEVPEVARRILVTFGGSDPRNVTMLIVEALKGLSDPGIEVSVVVGSSNPHRSELEEAIKKSPNMRLLFNVENMPHLMASADLAVTAGGGTCYELAYAGVPMFLITMAQNHEQTVRAWGNRGAAVNAGWFHQLKVPELRVQLTELIADRTSRRTLAQNAAQMVDGLGARRVVSTMLGRPTGLDR